MLARVLHHARQSALRATGGTAELAHSLRLFSTQFDHWKMFSGQHSLSTVPQPGTPWHMSQHIPLLQGHHSLLPETARALLELTTSPPMLLPDLDAAIEMEGACAFVGANPHAGLLQPGRVHHVPCVPPTALLIALPARCRPAQRWPSQRTMAVSHQAHLPAQPHHSQAAARLPQPHVHQGRQESDRPAEDQRAQQADGMMMLDSLFCGCFSMGYL